MEINLKLGRQISTDFTLCNTFNLEHMGARYNSVLKRPLTVQWVIGLILHCGPTELLYDWCTNDHGKCYPVGGILLLKETCYSYIRTLLMRKSFQYSAGSVFLLSVSEWVFYHMFDAI